MNRFLAFTAILLLFTSAGLKKNKKTSKKDTIVTISTEFGEMKLILFDDTPLHKENFIKLAKEGFYDSTTFHRVIDNFMIQGGDPNSKDSNPNNDGMGGPGYTVPAEIKHEHNYGALAAARKGGPSNPKKASSGSQFYIVENHEGTPFLNGEYTVYGQVIDGLNIIDSIADQTKNSRDRPIKNIHMTVTVKEVKKKSITKMYNYEYAN